MLMISENGLPHDLALRLMKHSPEYRELIRQRFSEAKKRQRAKDKAIYAAMWKRDYRWEDRPDVDLLGQDIEGCG